MCWRIASESENAGDGKISFAEAEKIVSLDNNWNLSKPIDGITGLEAFVNATFLDLSEPKDDL